MWQQMRSDLAAQGASGSSGLCPLSLSSWTQLLEAQGGRTGEQDAGPALETRYRTELEALAIR